MNRTFKQIPGIAFLSVPFMCTVGNPLHADDLSELYLSSMGGTRSSVGPNILIILDTSGSMTSHGLSGVGFEIDPVLYWNEPYDPDRTYPGPCLPDRAYRKSFSTDTNGDGVIDARDARDGDFSSCKDTDYWFPIETVRCSTFMKDHVAVDSWGEFRPRPPGIPNYKGVDLNNRWMDVNSAFSGVTWIGSPEFMVWRECSSDHGVHGMDGDSASVWAVQAPEAWSSTPVASNPLAGRPRYLVASGNYINYYRWAQTRLAAVQAALREVVTGLPPETNLSLMRFDVKVGSEGSSDGAFVLKEFVELGNNSYDAEGNLVALSPNRQAFIDAVFSIDPADNGGTPLGESLLEALLVYKGRQPAFGLASEVWEIDETRWPWDDNITTHRASPSVSASMENGRYRSPIRYECQRNAVILLSDGDPDGDKNAKTPFSQIDDRAKNVYAPDCTSETCLPAIADYMAHEDMSPLPGQQYVTTYTVGFGADISPYGQALLEDAARRGEGRFFLANTYETLKHAFEVIFRKEIAKNVSMTAPAVTVNAFNRMAHKKDLYFTMFDPIFDSVNWPGNLKKYQLKQFGDEFRIADANGVDALVEDSSQLAYHALSFWTNPADPDVAANGGRDGDKTMIGGAAGALPHPDQRRIFSWFGTTMDLTSAVNAFETGNDNITAEMLGLEADATAQRDNVIRFMRGHSFNGESTGAPERRWLGAAPHGVPAVVTYGEDEASAQEVIYMTTNDGFLHAIDASSGEELWAFVAPETMRHFASMMDPGSDPMLVYGLDASVITHAEPSENDERKWIFFGMRRGGRSLYALDVTDRMAPKLMWRIQGGVDDGFSALAQTWSDPRVGRMMVDGSPTTVLVFGGGYDNENQDSVAANAGRISDDKGHSLCIVRAQDGRLLWSAGGHDSGTSFHVSNMRNSIAASVKLKDFNEDGLTDIIYAADLAGQVFRFDVSNPGSGTFSIDGGMIASLGGADLANNRKFFNEPDVVLVARDGHAYWAINIGSGDRERPISNRDTANWLFSIKDPYVFSAPSNYDYGITMDSLYDITDTLVQSETDYQALLQAKGWKLRLPNPGEKALAPARTFDYRVFFTTFDPVPQDTDDCNSDPGTARLYSLDLITGAPLEDANNDGQLTVEDRAIILPHGTIPPGVLFMFVEDEDGKVVEETLVGRSNIDVNTGSGGVVRRTYWNVETKNPREQ